MRRKAIGQIIGDDLIKSILDSQGTDIDGVSGATVTADAVIAAVNEALDQASGKVMVSHEMTPGTYTGTAWGSKSDITVEIQVSENAIEAVRVIESDDSPYISEAAIEMIPKRIVEEQSLAVDAVTGATFTSSGIVSAAGEALRSAGANLADWTSGKKEKSQGEDVNTDVLVVGGGASGLVAALAAKTDTQLSDTDSGLDVMLIESNGYGGGNLTLCGGYIASYFGTPLNEKTGNSWTTDQLVDALEEANPQYTDVVNDYVLRQIVDLNDEVINGLMERGFYLTADDAYLAGSGGLNRDGSTEYYTSASVIANPETGERSGERGYDIYGGAAYLGRSLTELVEKAGVEIRLENTATSLIMEGNECKGVTVENHDSVYHIYAKKVILATGYAGLDQQTVDLFLPENYGDIINAQNAANTSFAQKEIFNMGGDVVKLLEKGYIVPGYNTVLAHYGEEGQLYRNMNAVWVNSAGERFMDETAPESGRGTEVGAVLLEQDKDSAWIIFDSSHEGVKYIDFLQKQGLAWEGDTIKDLADKAGLPSEALEATIEQYNMDSEGEGDTVYGTAKENMVPVVTAPFYGVKIGAASTAGIDVSIYSDENMNILLKKDGDKIENLYGTGGVVSNGYITLATVGLGTHVNASLLSGAYAGNCVRESLLEE